MFKLNLFKFFNGLIGITRPKTARGYIIVVMADHSPTPPRFLCCYASDREAPKV